MRQLPEAVAGEQVEPAVADVPDRQPVAVHEAATIVVPMPEYRLDVNGGLEDLHVGEVDGGPQAVAAAEREGSKPNGQSAIGRRVRRQEPDDGVDGDPRGDFAGLVAAHAVGHHAQVRAPRRTPSSLR